MDGAIDDGLSVSFFLSLYLPLLYDVDAIPFFSFSFCPDLISRATVFDFFHHFQDVFFVRFIIASTKKLSITGIDQILE